MMPSTPPQEQSAWSTLRRFARPRPPVERCDLCGAPLAAVHGHLLEPDESKELFAYVFKTRADPFAGRINLFRVYQGVLKQVDDIALAALGKWKFAPAKRGEKPVAVQILVGIQLSNASAPRLSTR